MDLSAILDKAIPVSGKVRFADMNPKDLTTLTDLIKTRQVRHRYKHLALVYHNDRRLCVTKSGVVFRPSDLHQMLMDMKIANTLSDPTYSVGVLALASHGKGARIILIENGDLNGDTRSTLFPKYPSVSFRCVARFVTDSLYELTRRGCKVLEQASVVAFTGDHLIPFSRKEKNALRRWNGMSFDASVRLARLSPPKMGYVAVKEGWHRSGSLLIQYGQRLFLFGVDEGSYFGCELKYDKNGGNPTSIQEAYRHLIPEHIRGKRLQRQGEWFVYPVSPREVPSLEETIAIGDKLTLPVDHADSSRHIIDTLSHLHIRVSPKGVFAKDGKLIHEFGEHEVINWSGWRSFAHNTAIRSVSEEGVD